MKLPKIQYLQFWREDGRTEIMTTPQFAHFVAYGENKEYFAKIREVPYKEACKLYDTNPELFENCKIPVAKMQDEKSPK